MYISAQSTALLLVSLIVLRDAVLAVNSARGDLTTA